MTPAPPPLWHFSTDLVARPFPFSEEKAIKPTNSKLVEKYAFSQAPRNLKNRLAGLGGIAGSGIWVIAGTGVQGVRLPRRV